MCLINPLTCSCPGICSHSTEVVLAQLLPPLAYQLARDQVEGGVHNGDDVGDHISILVSLLEALEQVIQRLDALVDGRAI